MTASSILLSALLVVGAAASPSLAQDVDPDAAAKKLQQEYEELRRKRDKPSRRLTILRTVPRHPSTTATKFLLRVVSRTKSNDTRIVAMLSLGQFADGATAAELVELVGKKNDPVVLQALGEALGASKNETVGGWLVRDGLSGSSLPTLTACVRAVDQLRLADATPRLTELYDLHAPKPKSVDLVHATVRALGHIAGKNAKLRLLDAATHDDWRVRLAAADVLADADPEDADIVTRVRTLLRDSQPQVRMAAIQSVGRTKLLALSPDLIDILATAPRLRMRHATVVALRAISGLDFEHDAGAWSTWWKERENPDWTPADFEKMTFARYYSGDLHTDRVVFITDLSGSMSWPWREEKKPKRIEVARTQLLGVLEHLTPGTLFNLLVYADDVRLWKKQEVLATPDELASARKWIAKRFEDPDGNTLMHDALEAAFARNPEFDTIYLLSDGNPSHGEYVEPEGVLCSVSVINRYRRAQINTIALTLESLDRGMPILSERPRVLKRFLKDLAVRNGGTTQAFSRPPR